jgi:hypothetical protein
MQYVKRSYRTLTANGVGLHRERKLIPLSMFQQS